MGDNYWQKVEQIVDTILDLPAKQRYAYIEKECGHNKRLKDEVTQLVESIFDSEGWLKDLKDHKHEFYNDVSEDLKSLSSTQDFVGQQVGSYTIKKKIGQGGMGLVYLAEHTDDNFNHQVAIKIIRDSQATEANIQRFRREQRILAGLNHPGIAQLYDGGIIDKETPYIIMEYVCGIPITEYCRKHNCSIEKRIDLFKQVLEAVRYAHENLVIHRDLKPDNILVDESGKIKVLDFGISKLLEDEDNLSLTKTGARLLTPKYAAPEQIKETNITTATDLYSLGVIFYELLSNKPPFDLDDCTTYQAEQIILKEAPPKPGSRCSDSQLSETLRGDLNAISLKAIRKEPNQRYRVATEFLEDLNNYLKGLPVSARTDSFQYRSYKFIGRHKQRLTAAAFIFILIIGLTGFYTWKIAEERNHARIEAQKAENISNFLLTLFESSHPSNAGPEDITARELLQEGRQKADQIIDEAMQANMLSVIGQAYAKLGYRDSALTILNQSKDLVKRTHGQESLEYATINFDIGNTYDVYADLALPFFRESYGIRSELLGKNHTRSAESLLQIGKTHNNLGNTDSARYYLERSEDIIARSTTPNPSIELEIDQEMARLYYRSKDYQKAEKAYLKLLSRPKDDLQTDSLAISRWNQNLAWVHIRQQQFDKAMPYLENALVITESLLGKGHEKTLKVRNDLAGVNIDLGNLERFQSLSEENIEYTISQYGNRHKMTCQANSAYGLQLTLYKIFDKGEIYLRQALEICSNAMGSNHVWTAFANAALSANLKFNNKPDASLKYFNEGHKIFKNNEGNLNRVNKRQISFLLKLYNEVDPSSKDRIKSYSDLLAEDDS